MVYLSIRFSLPEGGIPMDGKEFHSFRQKLQKTQKQLSQVLGTSLKSIQSFEQGWRNVPAPIERQMLFLFSMKRRGVRNSKPCWEILNCSSATRGACPAWEFNLGDLCWFINGTICRGKPQDSWAKKVRICRKCKVFSLTISGWEFFSREDRQLGTEAKWGTAQNMWKWTNSFGHRKDSHSPRSSGSKG